MPTADDEHMMRSFMVIITQLLVTYTTKNDNWKDHKNIAEVVKGMMQEDKPLPPEKTDAQPFGVFDVDKGTKKGIIKMFKAMQEWSTMSEEQWALINQINQVDWLTLNNTRATQ